jgi:hypothetical protein
MYAEAGTMIVSFNEVSLSRHCVTHEECYQVLADPGKLECDERESEEGNPCKLYVGYTLLDRRLEVMVEFGDSWAHVYHANTAKRESIRKCERKK